MNRVRVFVVGMYFASAICWGLAVAQEKPKTAKEEVKVKILRAQVAQARIQAELSACQARNWQGDYAAFNKQLQDAVDEAFKDSGLDKKDYDLNMDTFEFMKKGSVPVQPATPAKP
jgi:hypothetical protein